MTHVSRIAAVAVSAAALGLMVAGCEPQGGTTATATDEAPAAAEATTAAGDATVDIMPPKELAAAEISKLFLGNTVFGQLDSWQMEWAEFFHPNGTAMALLKFKDRDDVELTGKHYSNARDEWCTSYPDIESEQKVFCHKLVALGEGRYQQLYADGTLGGIYNQILQGEQIDQFR